MDIKTKRKVIRAQNPRATFDKLAGGILTYRCEVRYGSPCLMTCPIVFEILLDKIGDKVFDRWGTDAVNLLKWVV